MERKEFLYNCLGESLQGIQIQLSKAEYGYVDKHNIPHIDWGKENAECDKNGFFKGYRPNIESDAYVVKNYVVPKGTILCRYGYPGGIFTTLKGTMYENLGLPYVKETIEYHEYKVSEDLSVYCYVTKGIVAPKFLSKGGAIQFMHKQEIILECEDGFLEEDFTWIQKYI